MEPEPGVMQAAQPVSWQYLYTEVSGSAQARLGDYTGDTIHHHNYAPSVGAPKTPPSPISTVPFRRDPDYIDRESLLAQIETKFVEPAARVGLVGTGGVGKSQLAIEYCHRLREKCSDTWIFWIYASTVERVLEGFNEIAEAADLPGRHDLRTDIFDLVKSWLQRVKQRWLVVLDSLDDDAVLTLQRRGEFGESSQTQISKSRPLSNYLPQTSNGRLLLTTCSTAVALRFVEHRDSIQIPPLIHDAAVALLARKLDCATNEHDLGELATILELMPLAIVQAAAYIRRKAPRCSVREYIDLFNSGDEATTSLLSYEAGHQRRDPEAKNSIIRSWQLLFDHIHAKHPTAANLLSLMSFFEHQSIPEYALIAPLESQHFPDDAIVVDVQATFETDIETLRDYSLVSIGLDRSNFTMHRLVRLATQDWLVLRGRERTQRVVFLSKLAESFPHSIEQTDVNAQARCRELLPHVTRMEVACCSTTWEDTSVVTWASILYSAAFHLWNRGFIVDAERMCCVSKAALERCVYLVLELDSLIICLLADIHCYRGQPRQAVHLILTQLAANKGRFSGAHTATLTLNFSLAKAYTNLGQYDKSAEVHMEVMTALWETLGLDSEAVAACMVSLARNYHRQGRTELAVDTSTQVLEILNRLWDRKDLQLGLARTMGELAEVLLAQRKLVEAESCIFRVLDIYQASFGDADHWTLTAMHILGSIRIRQRRFDEAEKITLHALAIAERPPAMNYTGILCLKYNLSCIRLEQGRLKQAEDLSSYVFDAWQREYGDKHLNTLSTAHLLSIVLDKQGRRIEAEALALQVLERRRRMLGLENADTIDVLQTLGIVLSGQGRVMEAIAVMTECEQLRVKVFGATHPETLLVSEALSKLHARLAQEDVD